jgi:tetratricopeptide (TPR) repeat protein
MKAVLSIRPTHNVILVLSHRNVYKKWNERLFQEMFSAYESGRGEKDPSEGWYKGELWFYDNYIIPLAQKLEECGVFGVSSDECLNYALENRKEWALKGKQLVTEMKDRYQKRKMLEVGGFSPDEIDSFSPHDLEYILRRLIKKGRAFGTHQGLNKDGQKNAARAWLDALEIYEKAPAALSLRDKVIIFPVFSGLVVYLKGGLIVQDGKDRSFEQNLSHAFVREAKKLGDPVHYSRALATQADVLARQGKYKKALETFDTIMGIYDPGQHSEIVCKVYGTDRTAQMYSQRAMWYLQLGDTERAVQACDHVVNIILPLMDPKNILNTFELLLPVIRIQRSRGQANAMRKLFDFNVVQNFHKYEVKSTLCRPVLKPLLMLLQMLGSNSGSTDVGEKVTMLLGEENVTWLLVEENGVMSDFVDNLYSRLGWSPNSMTAELCLLVVKELREQGGSEESIRKLVQKGLKATMTADFNMKDEEGKVLIPTAYAIHEPVMDELVKLADGLGISWEDTQKQASDQAVTGKSLRTSLGVVTLKA